MPGELQVIERNVVRVVVLDADEHLLLFHTHDPVNPDPGRWWELPGGGIEPEETYQQAAVRELREEIGILINTGQVGPATWRRRATFRHRRRRLVQNEVIVAVRLATSGPPGRRIGPAGLREGGLLRLRLVAAGRRPHQPRTLLPRPPTCFPPSSPARPSTNHSKTAPDPTSLPHTRHSGGSGYWIKDS